MPTHGDGYNEEEFGHNKEVFVYCLGQWSRYVFYDHFIQLFFLAKGPFNRSNKVSFSNQGG
jgi:hypothetical protein